VTKKRGGTLEKCKLSYKDLFFKNIYDKKYHIMKPLKGCQSLICEKSQPVAFKNFQESNYDVFRLGNLSDTAS